MRITRTLGVMLVALLIGATGFLFGRARAETPSSQQAGAIVVCTVPGEWGSFRTSSQGLLIFEDAAGTLRIVDCQSHRPIVAFEIRRQ